MNLYNLSAQYRSALDNIDVDPETGELVGCADLDGINDAFESKAEAVACYIKELSADALAIKNEEATLYERRKANEKRVDRMKTYLSYCMGAAEVSKLNTPRCTVSFRASQEVQVINMDVLPEKFRRVKTTVEPDKVGIKAAVNGGDKVPGVIVVQKKNIQIK